MLIHSNEKVVLLKGHYSDYLHRIQHSFLEKWWEIRMRDFDRPIPGLHPWKRKKLNEFEIAKHWNKITSDRQNSSYM